jgi:hypothetical protein
VKVDLLKSRWDGKKNETTNYLPLKVANLEKFTWSYHILPYPAVPCCPHIAHIACSGGWTGWPLPYRVRHGRIQRPLKNGSCSTSVLLQSNTQKWLVTYGMLVKLIKHLSNVSNLGNSRFMKRTSTNLGSSYRLPHMCTKMMYGKFGQYRCKGKDACAQVWHNGITFKKVLSLWRFHRSLIYFMLHVQVLKTNVRPPHVSYCMSLCGGCLLVMWCVL